MGIFMYVCFLFLIIFSLFPKLSSAAACTNADYAGKNRVKDEDKEKGTNSGETFLMLANDNEFTFDCCGYIEQWEYYVKDNTGTMYLQVWRDTTATLSTWTLVGENMITQTDGTKGEYTETISAAERIMVQSGDVIGMHFPGITIITYDKGEQYKLTSGYTTTSTTFNWASVGSSNDRDYGIKAHLVASASPTIDNLDFTVTFPDSTGVSAVLYTLTVSDTDATDTLTTTETSNSAATLFDFNGANLQITTKASLTSGSYSMAFQVSDICGLTGTGTLTITITNTAPTIHNLPGSYSLSEDHTAETLLLTINVTDNADSVTCSITSSNPSSAPFTIKSGVGIYVNAAPGLDYNVASQYILTIECTDGKDPVTDTYTVYVVPNVAPTIHNVPSSSSLSEDQVSEALLYTLNVTDPTNDIITCSVTSPVSSPFFVKPVSGTSDYGIFVQYAPNLDYDITSQYDLTIECADSRNQVTGLYTVTVLENTAPVFTNLDNTSSVSTLTTGIGAQVFRIYSADNENDQLYYNMTSSPVTSLFTVLASGDVLTTSSLYGTTISSYDLSVYVYDGHTLVGPRTLTITVTDINNLPSFANTPSTPFVVNENSALGMSVYQSTVWDPDPSDTISFTAAFSPSSGAKYFKVNTASGLVTASSTNIINYEALTDTIYTITLYASDGLGFVSQMINITVVDVNEAPEFHKSFYSITEDEDLGSATVKDPGLTATDPDSGDSLLYAMDCGTYQAYFTMDPTSGNITMGTGYDLDTGSNPSSITCSVTVTDGQYTGTTQLGISINLRNDNLPLFNRPTYTFYTSAEVGIGTTVGTVSASDADTGIHGVITYSLNLTSVTCDCLAVTNVGTIYTKGSLLAFDSGAVFNFEVLATDGGKLQDKATITLVIPPSATTTTTTTTDRFITFTEDPRNSLWLVLTGFAFLFWLCLMAYFCYSFGWWDKMLNNCAEWSQRNCRQRLQRRIPKQRNYRREPQLHSHTPVVRTPPPVQNTRSEQWEPWRTTDFVNSSFS